MIQIYSLLSEHPLLGGMACVMLAVLGLFGIYVLTRVISYGILKTYKDLFNKEHTNGF